MGFNNLNQIEQIFIKLKVDRIYIKDLAQNQDNDKNQIYFGSGIDGITNLFDLQIKKGTPSKSIKKLHSNDGKPKLEAFIKFYWLNSVGTPCLAPNAKIIFYFQYPEVRFSGFLKNCKLSPECLRRAKQKIFGKRILIIGSDKNGKTYGLVLSELEDQIVKNFPTLIEHESIKIFKTKLLGFQNETSPIEQLKSELNLIVNKWHKSIRLDKNKGIIPFKGNQGAGYTLEALLDVETNSSKNPDKYGFEIKSFQSSKKLTLMTPTADIGEEGKLSFKIFMQNFGWKGQKDERKVFTGLYKFNKEKNNFLLDIVGFDYKVGKFTTKNTDQIYIGLFDRNRKLISGWTFKKLFDAWNKKHTSACYVEYEKRPCNYNTSEHDFEYKYTGKVFFTTGTQILLFFKSVANSIVYYDPAHEAKVDKPPKQRPQWRLSITKKFKDTLDNLYHQVEETSLISK